jgi:NADH-quinone oxidoreductase subunit C
MSNEDLKTSLSAIHSSLAFEEGTQWLTAQVEPMEFLPLAQQLRNNEHLFFDYLFCLTCVDWKTHLTMVYFFSSTKFRHTLIIKSKLNRNDPQIETVSHIWKTAEFNEREIFELFGVKFLHHPDLRNLILPDVWEGYPLRKDYEDAVNMIKL